MKYGLVLANPKDFYNEVHRASHFIKFIRSDDKDQVDEVDNEDFFQWNDRIYAYDWYW